MKIFSKILVIIFAVAAVVVAALFFEKRISESVKEEMPKAPLANPFYRDKVKRAVDLLIAIPVTIVAAIPMLLTAIAIKLDSPGPVIFKQDRIGKGGKVFQIWKFRSMCVNAEHTGSGVYSGKNDSRVTRVGRIIRATSIDGKVIIRQTLKNLDFARVSPVLSNCDFPSNCFILAPN